MIADDRDQMIIAVEIEVVIEVVIDEIQGLNTFLRYAFVIHAYVRRTDDRARDRDGDRSREDRSRGHDRH